MNKVEIVEVAGSRIRVTITQRHPDAVGMQVVLEEDLLKVVGAKAFGLNEAYESIPVAPLGHEIGNEDVFFDGSGPERFKTYFSVVEANIVREHADSYEINELLDKKGLPRGSAERDYAYHVEFDGRRGLMHLTIDALDPKWAVHLKAGDNFEI